MNQENINSNSVPDEKPEEAKSPEQGLELCLDTLDPEKSNLLDQAFNKSGLPFDYSKGEFLRLYNLIDVYDNKSKEKVIELVKDLLRSVNKENNQKLAREIAETLSI